MNAQEIKQEFERNRDTAPVTEINMGAVVGVLNKACGGDDNRHLIIKWLTGKISAKSLTPSELYALWCIVQPTKPEGGKWTTARGEDELKRICGIILTAAVDQDGQQKMFSDT